MIRLRARVGVWLIQLVRRVLAAPSEPHSGDYDTCIHCGATGCEDGTAEHAADCPQITGVWPIPLRDMWPYGPATCATCDTKLWPGTSASLIPLGGNTYEVACVGCALLVQVAPPDTGEGER